jgi:hypothetical protein
MEGIVPPGCDKSPGASRRCAQRRRRVAAFIALEDFLVPLGLMEQLRDAVRVRSGEVKRQRIDRGLIPEVLNAGRLIANILVRVHTHQMPGGRTQPTRPEVLPGVELIAVPSSERKFITDFKEHIIKAAKLRDGFVQQRLLVIFGGFAAG